MRVACACAIRHQLHNTRDKRNDRYPQRCPGPARHYRWLTGPGSTVRRALIQAPSPEPALEPTRHNANGQLVPWKQRPHKHNQGRNRPDLHTLSSNSNQMTMHHGSAASPQPACKPACKHGVVHGSRRNPRLHCPSSGQCRSILWIVPVWHLWACLSKHNPPDGCSAWICSRGPTPDGERERHRDVVRPLVGFGSRAGPRFQTDKPLTSA